MEKFTYLTLLGACLQRVMIDIFIYSFLSIKETSVRSFVKFEMKAISIIFTLKLTFFRRKYVIELRFWSDATNITF